MNSNELSITVLDENQLNNMNHVVVWSILLCLLDFCFNQWRKAMSEVTLTTHLKVKPNQVWDLIGQFNALADWHPAVEKSTLEEGGTVRKLSLVGGGEIVEKLIPTDEDNTYQYSILSGPLPVMNYTSKIRVIEDGDGAKVEWSSQFEPSGASESEAVDTIQGIYQAGFDNLKKMFNV